MVALPTLEAVVRLTQPTDIYYGASKINLATLMGIFGRGIFCSQIVVRNSEFVVEVEVEQRLIHV